MASVTVVVPSPFALPLMVERFREELSTEKLADRLQRILAQAQATLDGDAAQQSVTPGALRALRRGGARRQSA